MIMHRDITRHNNKHNKSKVAYHCSCIVSFKANKSKTSRASSVILHDNSRDDCAVLLKGLA